MLHSRKTRVAVRTLSQVLDHFAAEKEMLELCLRAVALGAIFLFLTVQGAHAQAPPCPSSGSTTNFTFAPSVTGDSRTETINLAPCETIAVYESHFIQDPNRGTVIKISFVNSSGQTILAQEFFGFNAGNNLNGGQSMSVHGTVTQNTQYGTNFELDIYDANQQLVTSGWIFTGTYGVQDYASQPFTNPNPTPADFYIRAWSYNHPTRDFSMIVDYQVVTCACPDIPIVP